LVKVKDSGGSTLASYGYDGFGRRVNETVSGSVTDFYYSAGWQVVEGRVAGVSKVNYVWSPVYIDAIIISDQDRDGNAGNGLEERIYSCQDADWSVTGLLSQTGQVVERYTYDTFGTAQVRTDAWSLRTSSLYNWKYLYKGGRVDDSTGTTAFRMRNYSPSLGRWAETDPIRYRSGSTNLYGYVNNRPIGNQDPLGLCNCGADITDKLKELLQKVTTTFQSLPTRDKVDVCKSIHGDGYFLPDRGWDISQLYDVDNQKWKQESFNYCNSDPLCADKVTVNGKCHFAGEVNYSLWGKINRLCNDFFQTAELETSTWGDITVIQFVFPDGTIVPFGLSFLLSDFRLAKALWYAEKWRTIFNGDDAGSKEVENRKLWTEAGWHDDLSKASSAGSGACSPCNKKYTGKMTARFGLSRREGGDGLRVEV